MPALICLTDRLADSRNCRTSLLYQTMVHQPSLLAEYYTQFLLTQETLQCEQITGERELIAQSPSQLFPRIVAFPQTPRISRMYVNHGHTTFGCAKH